MCIFSGAFSFALSLSHACILCFPLAQLCDYRDNNRDQNYPSFPSGAKDASPDDVLVIRLYVFNAPVNWGRSNKLSSYSVGEQVMAQ